MKFKPAMWAAASAPLLFLLLLVGGMRGFAYLRGVPLSDAAEAEAFVPQQNGQSPASAPPSPPLETADKATTKVLQKVVGGQIAALQKSNYMEALRFSAPQFRTQWTPNAFGQMITSGYPELIDSKTVAFGQAKVSPDGTVAFVTVAVRNAQKQETRFAYILTRDADPAKGTAKAKNNQAEGAWHVSGCERQSPPPVQAAPHSLNEA